MIHAEVTPLRLDGRAIRDAKNRPSSIFGELTMVVSPTAMPGRSANVLELTGGFGPGGRIEQLLPPLIDFEMVSFDKYGAVFRGLEEQGKDRHVAQSWRVVFHSRQQAL